jgi:hypothetical protein
MASRITTGNFNNTTSISFSLSFQEYLHILRITIKFITFDRIVCLFPIIFLSAIQS